MNKSKYLVAMVIAFGLFAGSPAEAGSAKFHSTGSTVNNDGALVVNWDQRGVGDENIDYTVSADATALYACINKGGKHPQASNKEAFEGTTTGGGSFEAKNGRVVASLTAGPLLAPTFTCPSGQKRVLASVSYSNIVLTDTTNGVVANIDPVSRTFFNV